jgi:hypothetical protein
MAKVTWRDSDPSDPMYSEGPRNYSPRWAQNLKDARLLRRPTRLDSQPGHARLGHQPQLQDLRHLEDSSWHAAKTLERHQARLSPGSARRRIGSRPT